MNKNLSKFGVSLGILLLHLAMAGAATANAVVVNLQDPAVRGEVKGYGATCSSEHSNDRKATHSCVVEKFNSAHKLDGVTYRIPPPQYAVDGQRRLR